MSVLLPVEEYVARLNRKRMAAGILFRDGAGRVLLVEPTYKPTWEIPGGAVEADEAPWAAAARELMEELGLRLPVGRLLVVDHVRARDLMPEGVAFVFDGGVLTDAHLRAVVHHDGEIRSASFHTLAEVRTLVQPWQADRIAAALHAVARNETVLCEHGVRIA